MFLSFFSFYPLSFSFNLLIFSSLSLSLSLFFQNLLLLLFLLLFGSASLSISSSFILLTFIVHSRSLMSLFCLTFYLSSLSSHLLSPSLSQSLPSLAFFVVPFIPLLFLLLSINLSSSLLFFLCLSLIFLFPSLFLFLLVPYLLLLFSSFLLYFLKCKFFRFSLVSSIYIFSSIFFIFISTFSCVHYTVGVSPFLLFEK